MNTSRLTSKEYFKGINLIYYALISGVLIFFLITLFLNFTGNIPISDIDEDVLLINVLIITGLVFLAAGIFGGQIFFNNKLKKINEQKEDLLIKTAEYRSSLIIRYALIEGPAFFSIIGYFLTASYIFIVFVGIAIAIYIIVLKPTRERLIIDLQLDNIEKEKIYDPNAIISEIVLRDN